MKVLRNKVDEDGSRNVSKRTGALGFVPYGRTNLMIMYATGEGQETTGGLLR